MYILQKESSCIINRIKVHVYITELRLMFIRTFHRIKAHVYFTELKLIHNIQI